MPKRYKILILVGFVLLFSCEKKDNKTKIAQVYDKYLYLEDIKDLIPKNSDKSDSIIIIKNKIDFWVKKQTMLKRAEHALTEDQKDIKKIVDDYKESLLIEKYKQEYIKQKLDTNISEKEIEKYYNDYPESFKINEEIVKALFFKIRLNKDIINDFKKAFFSNDKQKLIQVSKNKDIKFYDFGKKWHEISTVFNLLPNVITNAETLLKISKKFQTRDKSFSYFVIFKDYKLKGETIPLELASERIKIIILNKKKTNLILNLEKNIYQSDLKNDNIKIFLK